MWHLDGFAGYYLDTLRGEVVSHIQLLVKISKIKNNFYNWIIRSKIMPIPKDLLQKKWTLPKGWVMAGYVTSEVGFFKYRIKF